MSSLVPQSSRPELSEEVRALLALANIEVKWFTSLGKWHIRFWPYSYVDGFIDADSTIEEWRTTVTRYLAARAEHT